MMCHNECYQLSLKTPRIHQQAIFFRPVSMAYCVFLIFVRRLADTCPAVFWSLYLLRYLFGFLEKGDSGCSRAGYRKYEAQTNLDKNRMLMRMQSCDFPEFSLTNTHSHIHQNYGLLAIPNTNRGYQTSLLLPKMLKYAHQWYTCGACRILFSICQTPVACNNAGVFTTNYTAKRE